MKIYCPNCETRFGDPLEMEHAKSGWTYDLYRCPKCLHIRKIKPHFFDMDEIEEVGRHYRHNSSIQVYKEPSKLKKAAKIAGIGLAGIAGAAILSGLAAIADEASKNELIDLKDNNDN